MLRPLALALGLYLAGSLNFAVVVLRLCGKGDPRRSHSGNPGTSNVYRVAGPVYAALVLSLELARAGGAALLSAHLLPAEALPWAALALLAGNRWPLFHRFRGGKGVANLLGFTLPLHPTAAVAGMVAWVAVYGLVRRAYAGSLAMILLLCGGLYRAAGGTALAGLGAALTAALLLWAHRGNLRGERGKGRGRAGNV